MKGYISKLDKAKRYVNNSYPLNIYSEEQRANVLRQIFAKFLVGFETIGKVDGKFIVNNIHVGINYKSKTQRPWI